MEKETLEEVKNIDYVVLDYEKWPRDLFKRFKLLKGESLLQRSAFRWLLNGQVVSNGYEMFPMESICAANTLKVVIQISDSLAIVKANKDE